MTRCDTTNWDLTPANGAVANLLGAFIRPSCRTLVLVDQAAQPILPLDVAGRRSSEGKRSRQSHGRTESAAAVRAVRVVVGHVLAYDGLQLAAVGDHDPVQALVLGEQGDAEQEEVKQLPAA